MANHVFNGSNRSARNDVIVTSCSAILGVKKFGENTVMCTVLKLDKNIFDKIFTIQWDATP